ncbi:hypothetical protein [Paenibacillus lignilyticus]|uniref:DUF3021 domain-containing protein n=1 Tax=Paenibacillus lignilyticus TaxID=1172615 RepID=A0ABS5CKY5_9BACL|nr:hypothetical protein [Paenibacillus lignilyticus]MBP3966531.1 hypothetical protein [Paenibacillus lignilyticus]
MKVGVLIKERVEAIFYGGILLGIISIPYLTGKYSLNEIIIWIAILVFSMVCALLFGKYVEPILQNKFGINNLMKFLISSLLFIILYGTIFIGCIIFLKQDLISYLLLIGYLVYYIYLNYRRIYVQEIKDQNE